MMLTALAMPAVARIARQAAPTVNEAIQSKPQRSVRRHGGAEREDREQRRERGRDQAVARLDPLRDVFEQAAAEGGHAAKQQQGGEALLRRVAHRGEGDDAGEQADGDADAADARHGTDVEFLRPAEVVVGREPGMGMAGPDDQRACQRRDAERQEEQQHGPSLGRLRAGPVCSEPRNAARYTSAPVASRPWLHRPPLGFEAAGIALHRAVPSARFGVRRSQLFPEPDQ